MPTTPLVENNDPKSPVPKNRSRSDRREQPTPVLSRYTFWGKRGHFRRVEDQARGGYVDRYSSGLLLLLLVLLALNITDAVFTLFILDCGGSEANPLIGALMAHCGNEFWIWKFLIVAVAVLFLCLHAHFPRVKKGLWMVTLIYCGVVLYEVFIIWFQIPHAP
jgi:hypothetical protein